MEYLWIYTGTCDDSDSLLAAQDFKVTPPTRIAKRGADDNYKTAFYFPDFVNKAVGSVCPFLHESMKYCKIITKKHT